MPEVIDAATAPRWTMLPMRLEMVAPDQCLAHDLNWRVHPRTQMNALKSTIERVGFLEPILISEASGKVVNGHARVELALETGQATIPAVIISGMTAQDEADALVTMDPLGVLACQDEKKFLALQEMTSLRDNDAVMSMLAEMAKRIPSVADTMGNANTATPPGSGGDDFDTRLDPAQTRVKPGDLWYLGDHRILCADAGNPEALPFLVGDQADAIRLVLTDPPYNVGEAMGAFFDGNPISNGRAQKKLARAEWDVQFDPEQFLTALAGLNLHDYSLYLFSSQNTAPLYWAWLEAEGSAFVGFVVWCLCETTPLYVRSPDGVHVMTIRDMTRLQPTTLALWNGQHWTRILGWNRSDESTGMSITLRSGETLVCTREHLWPTQRGNVRAQDLRVGDCLDTVVLPEGNDAPPWLPDEEVGWFVGFYLAEGSRSGEKKEKIQLSCHAREAHLQERLQHIARCCHGSCHLSVSGNRANFRLYGKVLNALLDTYIGGRTAKSKHLSTACWRRSNVFLRALLQGYLDGDGHWESENNRWVLGFTRNDALARDLRTVGARLGIQVCLRPRSTVLNGKRLGVYRGEVRFEVSGHQNCKKVSEVVALGSTRATAFWDIAVEDEPHLFALASGVLTHNCKRNPMPSLMKRDWTYAAELIVYGRFGKHVFNFPETGHALNYFDFPTNGANTFNPAQKPIDLMSHVILHASNAQDKVLDAFLGSGTTLISCERTGRVCYGVELDPAQVNIALTRWEAETGTTALLYSSLPSACVAAPEPAPEGASIAL